MTHYKTYPFTAIIGQDLMKLALILNAINPRIGGVLIKGAKGTAKSTAVRALADLLPEVRTVKECPFNCNPDDPKEACHPCQHRIIEDKMKEEDIVFRHMRVINLPINATEDRVIGTISIEKALTQGLKALEPGILAESHRNILYIDEVNLLADNVADILLDAAAMGINIIEREGISLHHPAKFILVGTMNPEEGHLRPQLLDRFGLSVNVEKISDIDQRVKIIQNLEAYHNDPTKFHESMEPEQQKLRERIIHARALLPKVSICEKKLRKIAQICVDFKTEGHRADITINLTAKTLAAYEGHNDVTDENIKMAARLALPHRMRKLPFEEEYLDEERLQNSLDEPTQQQLNNQMENPVVNATNQSDLKDEHSIMNKQEMNNTKEATFGINEHINTDHLISKSRIREEMNSAGNIISHPTKSNRGKYIASKKATDINIPKHQDIAVLPTITSASLEPSNREAHLNGHPIEVKGEHIHIKRRQGKSSFLIIFCVDASGSMGVNERMEAAKGAIFSILQKNYINRDKVCLVVFRKETAELVLPPTRSTDLALKSTKEIPTGGATPLAAGLLKAYNVALEEKDKETGYFPQIVLITDARGNVGFKDAMEDAMGISKKIAESEIGLVVIDTEQGGVKLGLAEKIAQAAHGCYYHLDSLSTQHVDHVLMHEGLLNEL
jgi:magnesium chelatase subunit D